MMTARRLIDTLLHHIRRAKKSAKIIDRESNSVPLHRLRVELRRARTLLKIYQSSLPGLHPAKLRKGLEDLAAGTGEARDLDVHLAWLKRHASLFPPETKPLIGFLLKRWKKDHKEALRRIRKKIIPVFLIEVKQPVRKLKKFSGPLRHSVPAGRKEKKDLAVKMKKSGRRFNERALHKTRIAVKRYRYFLECAAPSDRRIAKLKRWQDRLGEIHDMGLIMKRIQSSANRKEDRLLTAAIDKHRKRLYRSFRSDLLRAKM